MRKALAVRADRRTSRTESPSCSTEDCIVGRFNGRMEYGPRALGNRSILYPAQDPEVNQWLNHQLGRTEFMPFAPAALANEARPPLQEPGRLREDGRVHDHHVRLHRGDEAALPGGGPRRRHRPAAAGAANGPTRASTASCEAYYDRTGIPAVINTSFNMHEEPIICSPQDAVRAFLLGNIDYLAIGPFLVPHPKLRENISTSGPPQSHRFLKPIFVAILDFGLSNGFPIMPAPMSRLLLNQQNGDEHDIDPSETNGDLLSSNSLAKTCATTSVFSSCP